jgi:hypothetical protein
VLGGTVDERRHRRARRAQVIVLVADAAAAADLIRAIAAAVMSMCLFHEQLELCAVQYDGNGAARTETGAHAV